MIARVVQKFKKKPSITLSILFDQLELMLSVIRLYAAQQKSLLVCKAKES